MTNRIIEGVEYAPSSEASHGYLKRADASDEWEDAGELGMDIMLEIGVEEAMVAARRKAGPAARPPIIRRAGSNDAIARELGFTGDEADVADSSKSEKATPADTLAQRLTDGGDLGTGTLVSEERFDQIAWELNQTPEELRDRFAGRHSDEAPV